MTNFGAIRVKLTKMFEERPALTSQFNVSKLQKQLRSVIRNHLDQSVNFGPLPRNVCMTVSNIITG